MKDRDKVRNFLKEQQHMVLAVTLADGTPWAVPVRIQAQRDAVFEWDSALATEHSRALVDHPAMAVAIYQKTEAAQIGVCMQGRGELVEVYKSGFGRYRFTAENIWLNDETFVKRAVTLGRDEEIDSQ